MEIESDNELLLKSLVIGSVVSSNLTELRLINDFLKRDWKIRIRHILRSQNMVVDQMVKCVYYNPLNLTFFKDPLIFIQEILKCEVISLTRLFNFIVFA